MVARSRKENSAAIEDVNVGEHVDANVNLDVNVSVEVDSGADVEKPKKQARRTRKKKNPEPEMLILPELAVTGMSKAWQAFYRTVAMEMKK
jgi:hypothetical protein